MADITLGSATATIAATATGLTATKAVGQRGMVLNAGAKTAYLGTNAGAAVAAADGTQEAYKIVLPTMISVPIPKGCSAFSAICAGTDSTTLVWIPLEDGE